METFMHLFSTLVNRRSSSFSRQDWSIFLASLVQDAGCIYSGHVQIWRLWQYQTSNHLSVERWKECLFGNFVLHVWTLVLMCSWRRKIVGYEQVGVHDEWRSIPCIRRRVTLIFCIKNSCLVLDAYLLERKWQRLCSTSICNGPTNHLHLHDFQHQHWLASCRSERSSSSKSSSLTALNHVHHFSKSITFIASLGHQPSLHGSRNISLPIHIQGDGRRKQFVSMVCPQLQVQMLTKVQGLWSSLDLN